MTIREDRREDRFHDMLEGFTGSFEEMLAMKSGDLEGRTAKPQEIVRLKKRINRKFHRD